MSKSPAVVATVVHIFSAKTETAGQSDFKVQKRLYSEEGGTNEALECPRPCHMDDYQTQMSLTYFPSEPDELPVKELDPWLGSSDV
ncbi:hypothetical protein ElyMa_005719900 [Elysia marginata]|uniref:Uncharacterized protein n=1 Tax=Elysia marginata TaxID=1093978 RepID=A0AAV4FJ90_9GAST|nr:hypothetical protein ElyMa_005719900 [Elysia marginata]